MLRTMRIACALCAVAVVAAFITGATALAQKPHMVRFCHGHRATIVDHKKGALLLGTSHRDVIYAGRGRDIIYGRNGKDLICSGTGNDAIDGMNGLDTVYGGKGTDWCLAPTHREHMRHHACEVHVQTPRHHKPKAKGIRNALQAKVQRVPAEAVRANSTCGSNCSAGIPVCQSSGINGGEQGSITWQNGGGGQLPTVYLKDPGYILMWWTYQSQTVDGSMTIWNNPQYVHTARLNPGGYYVTPNPAKVIVPTIPASVGKVWVFFSYSSDDQNWTPWTVNEANNYVMGIQGISSTSLFTPGSCYTGEGI